MPIGNTAPIQTDRCTLRPVVTSDLGDFQDLCADQRVRAFLGGPLDSDQAIRRFEGMLAAVRALHWAVRLRQGGTFIGLISIDRHRDGGAYEISYQLLPRYWGRGLARETVAAALAGGLDHLGVDTMLAETQVANERSIALLGAIGFTEQARATRFGAVQSIQRFQA